MKYPLFFFLCYVLQQPLLKTYSKREFDSFISPLPAAKEDTNKIKQYILILGCCLPLNRQDGIKFEIPALEQAEKLNWKVGVAEITNAASRIYRLL